MPPWLTENLPLIQTITAVITACIWLTYLQIIVSGLLRQRRSVLSLNRGGEKVWRPICCRPISGRSHFTSATSL